VAGNRRENGREAGDVILRTLPNGLRVVLQPVRFAPVAAAAVWVNVGSADESAAEAGLAHLHEHMIFKGTGRRGVGQIAREIEGAGGEINAFTSYDQTCYYLTLGRDEAKLGLDILADAVNHAAFDAGELRKEVQVILDEIRLYRDLPHYHISENCWRKAFARHPYGKPILGSPEVLQNLRRRDVLRFFGKYYRPENMVLAVTGDFEPAPIQRLIGRLFGGAAAGSVCRPPRPAEPRQREFRGLALSDAVQQTHLYFAWHGVAWDQPLAAELDLLSIILGQGDSSRLHHRIQSMKGLVHDVSASSFAAGDPGLFCIEAVTDPELLKDAYRAVLAEVYRLRTEPVREEELARAKRNIEAAFIGKPETAGGIGYALGYSVALTGDVHLERDYLARVMAADREGLRRAANTFLDHRNLTAAVLSPNGRKTTVRELEGWSAEIFRRPAAEVKKPGRTKTWPATRLQGEAGRRGRLKKALLGNGIRVVVQESAHAPIVSLRTAMLGGLRYEAAGQDGLGHLTASLLSRGTRDKSALAFARQVEGMAGNLHGISGHNSIGIAADFLSRDFARGLDLVAEAMLTPAFRTAEFKRKRAETIGRLRERHDNPSYVVREIFARSLYPDHPYGRALLGAEETLANLSSRDAATYWKNLLRPENIVIGVAGDVCFERTVEHLERAFGALPARGFEPLALPSPKPPAKIVVTGRAMSKEQTHILVGFLGCRIGQADEWPLQVLNAVLTGQGGRLFLELRDRRHLAYSVYSFHREGIERGSFGVYIATGHHTAETALTALLEELRRVVRQPPRQREIERAKRYLIGSQQLDLQTADSIALTMSLNELLGPGYREHRRLAEKIRAVTPAQVAQAAAKYLTLNRMVIAQVGEGAESLHGDLPPDRLPS